MKLSKQASTDLKELRAELKKENPDGERIFELLSGTKYNIPINPKS